MLLFWGVVDTGQGDTPLTPSESHSPTSPFHPVREGLVTPFSQQNMTKVAGKLLLWLLHYVRPHLSRAEQVLLALRKQIATTDLRMGCMAKNSRWFQPTVIKWMGSSALWPLEKEESCQHPEWVWEWISLETRKETAAQPTHWLWPVGPWAEIQVKLCSGSFPTETVR